MGPADPGHHKSRFPLFDGPRTGGQDAHIAAVSKESTEEAGGGLARFWWVVWVELPLVVAMEGCASSQPLLFSLHTTHRLLTRIRGGASNEKGKDGKIQGPCIGIDLGTTYSCVAVRECVVERRGGWDVLPSLFLLLSALLSGP